MFDWYGKNGLPGDVWFFIISILIHFFIIFAYTLNLLDTNNAVQRPIHVVLVDESERRLLEDSQRKRIVDLTQPESERAPKNPRFYAEKNAFVEKETVAIRQSQNPGAQSPGSVRPKKESFTLQREGLLQRKESEGAGERMGMPGDREIYLPEVAQPGERTLLNAAEFVYAGYYNRIKRKVQNVWSPVDTIRDLDLSRYDEISTVVSFTLNGDGTLHDLGIRRSSGIRAFDDEALRALRESTPFPNPPPGMIAPDGRVHISEWGFILFKSRWVYAIY